MIDTRCRGLKVLVDLLDEDYREQADLVAHALVGVGSVFELQVPQIVRCQVKYQQLTSGSRARRQKTISAECSFVKVYWM